MHFRAGVQHLPRILQGTKYVCLADGHTCSTCRAAIWSESVVRSLQTLCCSPIETSDRQCSMPAAHEPVTHSGAACLVQRQHVWSVPSQSMLRQRWLAVSCPPFSSSCQCNFKYSQLSACLPSLVLPAKSCPLVACQFEEAVESVSIAGLGLLYAEPASVPVLQSRPSEPPPNSTVPPEQSTKAPADAPGQSAPAGPSAGPRMPLTAALSASDNNDDSMPLTAALSASDNNDDIAAGRTAVNRPEHDDLLAEMQGNQDFDVDPQADDRDSEGEGDDSDEDPDSVRRGPSAEEEKALLDSMDASPRLRAFFQEFKQANAKRQKCEAGSECMPACLGRLAQYLGSECFLYVGIQNQCANVTQSGPLHAIPVLFDMTRHPTP